MATYRSNLAQLTPMSAQSLQRKSTQARRRLATKMRPPQAGRTNRQQDLTRRWATVVAVNPAGGGQGTVTLAIDGQTLTDQGGGTGAALVFWCLASYENPTVGDVVLVDFLGADLVVLGPTWNSGDMDGDVPIGGLVNSYIYSGSTVTATNTTVTIGSFTAPIIAGHTYLLTATGIFSVSGSTVPLYANISCTSAGSLIHGTGFVSSVNNPPLTSANPGTLTSDISSATTITDTYTFKLTGAGASAPVAVGNGGVVARIVRTG
jgi:hypothetical protein